MPTNSNSDKSNATKNNKTKKMVTNGKKKNAKNKKSKDRNGDSTTEVMLKPIHSQNSNNILLNHNDDLEDRRSIDKHRADEEHHAVATHKARKKRRRTNRCICVTISAVLVLIFCGAIAILVLLFLMVGERPPKVNTDCGIVEGVFESATKSFTFKGIPYAKAPIGVLRWQPPEALFNESCWKGVFKADKNPRQCAQKDPKTTRISGHEDCLYLNIYTPAIDPLKPAPVMVYIHGGYLQWGNASTPGYCPDEKAALDLGVVFVNIQYRLNAFGFLVTTAQNGNGNYGLLDQVLALTWIKKNIRKFGGDPDKITVFGQSSGGTSVFALMTSPLAKGLFHRAWMLSGSPVLDKSLIDAREQNAFFLTKTNCSNEACLLRKSTEEILDAIYPDWDVLDNSMNLPKRGVFEPALAIIDGHMLPRAPFDTWDDKNTENYSDIPFIIGTTAQEIDYRPTPGNAIKKWDSKDLQHYVSQHLDTFDPMLSNRSLTTYSSLKGDEEYIFTTMATDIRVTCGNHRLAAKAAEALTSHVYRYVVTSCPSKGARALNVDFTAKYAFHGWDIYAFLDTYDTIMSGESDSDKRFSNVLQENIMNFITSSSPRDKSWLPYPQKVALINSRIEVNKTYNSEQCALWRDVSDVNFFRYSWSN